MEFYTNIQVSGDHILVRSVKDGDRIKYREYFEPSLYTLSNTNSEVPYYSYNGEKLKEIRPGSIRSTRSFIKDTKNVEGMPIFGNIDYIYQYISHRDWYQCDYDLSKICICNIDIETESEHGFPQVEQARESITAITLKDNLTNKFWVFGRGGCMRVGVPYIYMYGQRVAPRGVFLTQSLLFILLWWCPLHQISPDDRPIPIWKNPSGQSSQLSRKILLEWEQIGRTVFSADHSCM